MPVLENVVEGLANAAGDTTSVNMIEKRKKQRTDLSDAERQTNVDSYNQAIGQIQGKMSSVDPKSPEYGTLQTALQKAIGDRTSLFHPAQEPSAIGKLGELLHLKKPAAQPAPGGGGVSAALSAGAPNSQQAPDKMTELENAYQKAFGTPIPADKKQAFFNHLYGGAALEPKETPVKYQNQLQETTDEQGKKHYWRVPLNEGGDPEEVDFKGQAVTPKGSAGAHPKVGSFGDFMMQAYGSQPTAQQYADGRKRWAQAASGTTVGTHIIQVPQTDGSIKAYEVQTTSHKEFGSPSIPKTPGEAKQKAANASAGSGVVKPGDTLGGKLTAPQTKAQNDYVAATKLASVGQQVLAAPDAVTQKKLALNLIKESAGRVNMQEIDMLTKRAGVANTFEQWANNVETGQLPADIVRQLVKATQENLVASKKALDTAMNLGKQEGQKEKTATGPNGHKIVLRGGAWVDAETGQPAK